MRLYKAISMFNYAFSLALALFLGSSTAWILGKTPPWAMVTPARSLFSSSSFLSNQIRGRLKSTIQAT